MPIQITDAIEEASAAIARTEAGLVELNRMIAALTDKMGRP